jgi:3',5'-cyclic-nucleotide phosphodiesterase
MKDTKTLKIIRSMLLLLSVFSTILGTSQNNFKMVVLGSGGGIDESNLSAYLLAPANTDRYICLDAGSLMHGIDVACAQGQFDNIEKTDQNSSLSANILHHHIDAYVISHPHLDHIMGMLMAAPFDNHKNIVCSPKTADALMEHIFESPLWGNFTSEGTHPVGKWDIIRLADQEWINIPNNSMKLKSFTLCHSCPNESNAFLIENNDHYCLYFGDTGADKIEGQPKIENVFKSIKPLVQQNKLKAIFIEVSFPNDRDNHHLYGHLKPALLEEELQKLAILISPKKTSAALQGVSIFITHIKPNYQTPQNSRDIIIRECEQMQHFGARFIYPKQAEKYEF